MSNRYRCFLLFFFACSLCAQDNGLATMVDSLLHKDTGYRQVLIKYEQTKASYRIEKSVQWADLNLVYRRNENDYTRDEKVNILERSKVEEKDRRYRVELSKQLFSKDFDTEGDLISFRMETLRYNQELKLAYIRYSATILDDMIQWYRASQMIPLLHGKLDILYQQNETLEDMVSKQEINSDLLISNMDEINEQEEMLAGYERVLHNLNHQYGSLPSTFASALRDYILQKPVPDTIKLIDSINRQTEALQSEKRKVERRIQSHSFSYFMPEINLALSYNWRNTDQDWSIRKNNLLTNKIVNQQEAFPEAELEFSLPLDIFRNVGSKRALLKSYHQELQNRVDDFHLSWQNAASNLMNQYHADQLEFQRKNRLQSLYAAKVNSQIATFSEEPLLLGLNPQLNLEKEKLRMQQANLEQQIAEMKLYKAIFLINRLAEVRP